MSADQAFDETVKLERHVRVLIDAGEHELAMQLLEEAQAVTTVEAEIEEVP